MGHLPPTGWAEVPTKRDLDHLEASTRGDVERFQAPTRADIEQLETAVRGDIEQLASATRAELQAVRADLLATMLQQNRAMFFAMAGPMITLAALAFGAARLG